MSGPTKYAKPVDIIDHPYTVVEIRSEYQCPCCKTVFYNGGPNKRVKVFVCECGQELKVRNRLPPPVEDKNIVRCKTVKASII